jgi:D-arabinan endo alpha-(1,5)-arabinofuranosidase
VLAAAVQALALPELPQPGPGQAINLGPIAGTESPTGALGAGAVDLCEISPGGQVALGGDTFSGNAALSGAWSPSMALHVRPGTLNSNPIQFDGSFGQNGSLYAEPPPPVAGGSQLPAGTVQVFGIDYALVTRTANLQPIDTRLVQIDPNNPGWPTVPGSLRDAASWQDGNETQISGYQAPDGWVYIVADGFARDHSVWLYHCPAESFTDRNTWWAWGMIDGGPDWGWNVAPTPLSGDIFGELSLRLIENMAVLSGFNATSGNVEVRVADDVTQVLAPDTPVTIVATQETVPQNYGGYIVPGSTLDQAIILVSQWNTATNDPYNVQQFVVNLNR